MRHLLRPSLLSALLYLIGGVASAQSGPAPTYAEIFDAHWETLRDGYPYFELYGVDWEAERAEHRSPAIAAESDDEFAWELARLICVLPDAHVAFRPAISTMAGRWSYPDLNTKRIGRRPYVLSWPGDDRLSGGPDAYADDPRAYPEIILVEGVVPIGAAEVLAAGPLGSLIDLRLRWPDGTETDHEVARPETSNLPPEKKHFGDSWLVTGRAGDIGYMAVRTFDPEKATLGPDGKMTTMLRAALVELMDTKGLVLDFQGNGGGHVAASDPFLGHIVEKRISYEWGNSGGKHRVITPRYPRYRGEVVSIVDERSASGGEWAPRILRDAGRAPIVGGRTQGAEAAVLTSKGPDGSIVYYSGWPMVEPGVTPIQEVGVALDHVFELTIEDVRSHGYEEALARVRRARFAKAVELLEGDQGQVDALLELADG